MTCSRQHHVRQSTALLPKRHHSLSRSITVPTHVTPRVSVSLLLRLRLALLRLPPPLRPQRWRVSGNKWSGATRLLLQLPLRSRGSGTRAKLDARPAGLSPLDASNNSSRSAAACFALGQAASLPPFGIFNIPGSHDVSLGCAEL
jgi:hypothetical protein